MASRESRRNGCYVTAPTGSTRTTPIPVGERFRCLLSIVRLCARSTSEITKAQAPRQSLVWVSEGEIVGLFSKWKKSAAKSRLIQSAAKQVQSGQTAAAVGDIFDFLQTDEAFRRIIAHFKATATDIERIIIGLMFSGAGGTYRGHFVPVSAVLFHDTLAYMLRVERGQVSRAQAYFDVLDYFQSGGVVFQPERAFHMSS